MKHRYGNEIFLMRITTHTIHAFYREKRRKKKELIRGELIGAKLTAAWRLLAVNSYVCNFPTYICSSFHETRLLTRKYGILAHGWMSRLISHELLFLGSALDRRRYIYIYIHTYHHSPMFCCIYSYVLYIAESRENPSLFGKSNLPFFLTWIFLTLLPLFLSWYSFLERNHPCWILFIFLAW